MGQNRAFSACFPSMLNSYIFSISLNKTAVLPGLNLSSQRSLLQTPPPQPQLPQLRRSASTSSSEITSANIRRHIFCTSTQNSIKAAIPKKPKSNEVVMMYVLWGCPRVIIVNHLLSALLPLYRLRSRLRSRHTLHVRGARQQAAFFCISDKPLTAATGRTHPRSPQPQP